jgi:hypothetical protein
LLFGLKNTYCLLTTGLEKLFREKWRINATDFQRKSGIKAIELMVFKSEAKVIKEIKLQ